MELIIVLGIVSAFWIFVAFGSASERRQLEHWARILTTEIRYTQNLAISENHPHRIIIAPYAPNPFFPDQSGNEYRISREGAPMGEVIRRVPVEGVRIIDNSVPNRLRAIYFTSRGTPRDAATITLETDNYRIQMTITVGGGRVLVGPVQRRIQ